MAQKRSSTRKGQKEADESESPYLLPGELQFNIDEDDAEASESDGESSAADGSDVDAGDDSDSDASEDDADGNDGETQQAIAEYYDAARDDVSDTLSGEEGGEPGGEQEGNDDPGSDSSEDERPNRNTVGNIPLEWYKHEEHIGYDKEGKKLAKKGQRDRLEEHLARQDGGKAWRTIYDEYNDEEIVLSKEEIQMIQRIRSGKFPHLEVDPYPEYNDFFTKDVNIHPVLNLPEPKRRFVRSKWEEKKVVKLVRAMRKGWLKRQEKGKSEEEEEAPAYLMWEEDNQISEKTAVGLSYIPPPKPKLPGHDQSYNPPQEYLPNEEERRQWEEADPEDRPKLLPQQFDSLRTVPMYGDFIKERFERCLDMYLCPRSRKKRIHIDPESLVPKLPKPADLQPFPMTLSLEYTGHTKKVTSISIDPTGQWLASGSADCSLRLWEIQTGRCHHVWDLGSAVQSVAWCPDSSKQLVAAAAANSLFLFPAGIRRGDLVEHSFRGAVKPSGETDPNPNEAPLVQWQPSGDGTELLHKFPVMSVIWHGHGDYFATVAPTGNTQAVVVHQLSKQTSQNPFRKNRGRVQRVQFHPTKPFFFVATSNHVRVYNLTKQSLARKLIGGSGVITSLDVHPMGDNLIVGCEDNRLLWFDMDLSARPYRSLKYHSKPIRGAAYHRSYPLFATASDDATIQVFHGMVYADLMTNPLLVPVKILRGHAVNDFQGVLDVKFHPSQPWLVSAGADGTIKLWCN